MAGLPILWRTAVGAALAAAIAGAPCRAAEPDWAVDPEPPRALSDETVDAWVKQHLAVGGYLQTGYNSKVVGFISTEGVDLPAPDVIRAWLRFETFRVAASKDVRVASLRVLAEFDCRLQRHRELAHEYYPLHNLKGMPTEDVDADARWLDDAAGGVWAVNQQVLCRVKDAVARP